MASRLKPTDLVIAARLGQCEKARTILQAYPGEVDVELSGKTALQEAALQGYDKFIQVLLRSNADLYKDDSTFRTPLHYAVLGNKPKAVLLLLKSDERRRLIEEKDIEGLTAPQLAFEMKHKECVKVFMDWDISIKFKRGRDNMDVPSNNAIVREEPAGDVETTGGSEQRTSKELAQEKCYICKENPVTIKFEPCGCQKSCLECSVLYPACFCGQPIEKYSFSGTHQIKELIKELQRDQKLLKKAREENQRNITCHICTNLPIMCTLQCGHMFCIPCIKKIKQASGMRDAACPDCRDISRYTVLHPPWPTKTQDLMRD